MFVVVVSCSIPLKPMEWVLPLLTLSFSSEFLESKIAHPVAFDVRVSTVPLVVVMVEVSVCVMRAQPVKQAQVMIKKIGFIS